MESSRLRRAPLMRGAALPALPAGTSALLMVLTGCGGAPGQEDRPAASGTAAPDSRTDDGAQAAGAQPRATSSHPASPERTPSHSTASRRCSTSDVAFSIGANEPGAGRENFSLILTNISAGTCTLYGYPGAEFRDAKNNAVTTNPVRVAPSSGLVSLRPGTRATAQLSFSDPATSGAVSAAPARLVVTPPDETRTLSAAWTHGAVPTGGNASAVRISAFQPGSGG
ncbi:lipoprotein [Streptomyces cellostaticus]|nr:lipoprotein [Streptomyces cellostaticus]